MTVVNLSERNIYIQKATSNGKPVNCPYFSYKEIKDGGELITHMSPKPNNKLGLQVDFGALNAIDEIK